MSLPLTSAPPTVPERRRRPPSRLVFGQMFEDAAIDDDVLPPGRVLCIASAGDTAMRLAASGREVVAVDDNTVQLRYLADRLAGGPVRAGSADVLLSWGRHALRGLGWSSETVRAFCELDDPDAQVRRWHDELDNRRFRATLRLLLSRRGVGRGGFAPFAAAAGTRFDLVMRQRLLSGLARHPNRSNPYLRRLLIGEPVPSAVPVNASAVSLIEADVLAWLERAPAGSFDGFSLSNVLDAVPTSYAIRLREAVRRAARPGAVVVYRSFAEPATHGEAEAAATDRSLIWGSIRIEPAGAGR